MKVACSSVSFGGAFAAGELTQLEWLDVCANELEVDGVVFAAAHFPRGDRDYLAQLKKVAADLGLTVAAVAADEALCGEHDRWLEVALALGAPLLVARAASSRGEPAAWSEFVASAKRCAGSAKRANVTLGVRNGPGTLCESVADMRRLAKDVDSAWLRYAPDFSAFGSAEPTLPLLPSSNIAMHAIADLETFALPEDAELDGLLAALARFRGFVVLEGPPTVPPSDAYYAAVRRFEQRRHDALEHEPAQPSP